MKRSFKKTLTVILILLTLIFTNSAFSVDNALPSLPPLPAGGILIDHNTRDISKIPVQWISAAKQNVVWVLGSASARHATLDWR